METDSSLQYEAQQALFEALCRPQMSNQTPEAAQGGVAPQDLTESTPSPASSIASHDAKIKANSQFKGLPPPPSRFASDW